MEENKLFNVPVELFELDKIVLNKNKTAKVDFRIIDSRGSKNEVYKGSLTPDYQTVMELQLKLEDLKPYLLKLRHIREEEQEKIKIKGLVWKGQGETEAFSILGTDKSDSEKNMPCDSAVEHIGVDKYDFEMEVRAIIIDIEVLAHGYIFEGKKADIVIPLGNGNED